ncbi:helix-turn-helix domain-containing protein [Heyndrickxia coagulans]|uniref:Transcriptional regulator, contains XRE-family HTH domain n=1 Tax=Heyndrickxia coagulans DSM 1 = ATCC 7050 TaxID=1121088 RepID=A0A8B4BW62_HEYCO|nr:helix-turn-helix transcriptional regulator [Heyndrickxia coagulans]AJH78888.1 helix-turn-helix family protein [Heyndrickxia coagulans DSM 1 = ATCC 7050]MCR2846597.1 helix-turn-helix transcriptional regulator [Heyndrickxia coagulans]MDR4224323.1 helix-turn-helix transcriptional regulator [Heyndrickxia coagulans DSM 1 = ATCC 7050]MED4495298.1 helix-turn-helix transcriptional regulator [Heyndrickxia coagulans]MED4537245.1 helix-turn-helix transcriptional regulator [Heyndrickxia coagulans]
MADHENENMDNVKAIFAARLKKVRAAQGYSQPELAKRVGVSDRNISNYETGYSFPSIKVLYRISQVLKVSIDYLLGLTNHVGLKTNEAVSNPEKKLLETLSHEPDLYQMMLKDPEKMANRIYQTWNLIRELDDEDDRNT